MRGLSRTRKDAWAINWERYKRTNIRWLGRRPMRKEGINVIWMGDLENRQQQDAYIVFL